MMPLFKFRGGAKVAGRKDLTADRKIVRAPLPPVLHIPLQQHVGVGAVPCVSVGDRVMKGQLIAESKGSVSAPVHAPTSGTVTRIGDYLAPHPSGLPVPTLSMEPDGEEKWCDLPEPLSPAASAEQIADRVAEGGVVGMGGAAFPSALKLNQGKQYQLDMLILNGAECEPYLTCDDRLMRERPELVIRGMQLMMRALGMEKGVVAIEDNKPQSFNIMRQACNQLDHIEVQYVPARYPMGSSKHLVKAVTGREVPATGLTAELGVMVHNVATAFAVYEAVELGRPLISRIVTLSGRAVCSPENYETLLGTPISWLVKQSGGFRQQPQQLLMGGPMMGQPLPNLDVPVTKGTTGILALKEDEIEVQNTMPCIGCGSCVTVCPSGLLPLELANRLEHEDIDGADSIGLRDCISCGSCNYVCPSHIPLVQYFNYGKGKLKIQDSQKKQHERIKTLTEQRIVRQERRAKGEV
jgi:electron transport complex protein RnfC